MDPDRWNSLTPAQQDAFLNGPALAPPAGVKSNFVDPPNHNATVIGVTTMCVALAAVMVLLRAYSKLCVSKKVNIEDVLGLIAFGTYLGAIWSILHAVHLGGFFVHQWDVTFGVFQNVLYVYFLIPDFYAFTMLFAKTAIILEWMRIFVPKGTRNFFFWTCLSILSVNAAFYVVAIFIINLTCRPVQKSWYLMTPGVCFGAETRRHFDFSSACINLALDILILFLPQRTIWTLNMPSKKKIGVSLVFTIGLGACAAALGRVITGRTLFGSQDRTYDAAAPTLCVLAEMTCTFLVFSSPAILKVFTKTRATMQIAETLRSWSRIFSRNRSVGSNTSGQNAGMEPGAYRKMHENSELPLARLSRPAEGGAKPWAGGAIHGGRQRDHDDEILRSTTLSADGHELAS